jgi:hypothetical protein
VIDAEDVELAHASPGDWLKAALWEREECADSFRTFQAIRMYGATAKIEDIPTGLIGFLRPEDIGVIRQCASQALCHACEGEVLLDGEDTEALRARLSFLADAYLHHDFLVSPENTALASAVFRASVLAGCHDRVRLAQRLASLNRPRMAARALKAFQDAIAARKRHGIPTEDLGEICNILKSREDGR